MVINKEQLIFDINDLETSDQVGSHILGTDDRKVTSTTDSGREGLDVNVLANIKNQILAAQDRSQILEYDDFGTKNQRIVKITYTSSLFPGIEAIKTINYTLVGVNYRRDSIIWSIS